MLRPRNRKEKIVSEPSKPEGKNWPWEKFWQKNHANMGDPRTYAESTNRWGMLKIEKPKWKTCSHIQNMPIEQMPFLELDLDLVLCSSFALLSHAVPCKLMVLMLFFLCLFGWAVSFQGCNFVAKWVVAHARLKRNTWPTLARLFGNLRATECKVLLKLQQGHIGLDKRPKAFWEHGPETQRT